jgi:hypothetical protein
MRAQSVRGLLISCADFNAAARVVAARTLLEENERTPAGNNMPQVPGVAILIVIRAAVRH